MAFVINHGLVRTVAPNVTGGPARQGVTSAPPIALSSFSHIAINYADYRHFLDHLDPSLDPTARQRPGFVMSPRYRDYLTRNSRSMLSGKLVRFTRTGWDRYESADLSLKSAILQFHKLMYFQFHATQPKLSLARIAILNPDQTLCGIWWLPGPGGLGATGGLGT